MQPCVDVSILLTDIRRVDQNKGGQSIEEKNSQKIGQAAVHLDGSR